VVIVVVVYRGSDSGSSGSSSLLHPCGRETEYVIAQNL